MLWSFPSSTTVRRYPLHTPCSSFPFLATHGSPNFSEDAIIQLTFFTVFIVDHNYKFIMTLKLLFIKTSVLFHALNPSKRLIRHMKRSPLFPSSTLALRVQSTGLVLIGASSTKIDLERCHITKASIAWCALQNDFLSCLCVFSNVPSVPA